MNRKILYKNIRNKTPPNFQDRMLNLYEIIDFNVIRRKYEHDAIYYYPKLHENSLQKTYLPSSNFEMSVTVSNPLMFVSEYACFDQLVS
jgi:hypothetical protein